MKVTLSMAMSANGMTCREDGTEDFLSEANWGRFVALVHEHGNLIWGRKTYEAVTAPDAGYDLAPLATATKLVLSRDAAYAVAPGYTLVASPEEALAVLTERGFASALISGGATINTAFAQAKLIDEIVLDVEPVFVGRGLGVFSPADFDLAAELVATEKHDQIMTMRYRII